MKNNTVHIVNDSLLSTPNIYSSNHSRINNTRRFKSNSFRAEKKLCFSQILCNKNYIKKNKIYEIGLNENYIFDEEKNNN